MTTTRLTRIDEKSFDHLVMSGHAQFSRNAYGNKQKRLWRGTVGGLSVIKDIIATSDIGRKEDPKHINYEWKKKANFYRTDTRFAIGTEDGGYEIYPCKLIIAEIKGGERYVYDLVDIGLPTHAATVGPNVTTFNGSGVHGTASTAFTAVSANPVPRNIPKSGVDGNGGKFSIRKKLEQKDLDALANHYGTTDDFRFGGFVMPDGRMLDFSGKHEGATNPQSRGVDHREIKDVLDSSSGFERTGLQALTDAIGSGMIRVMPEAGGIACKMVTVLAL